MSEETTGRIDETNNRMAVVLDYLPLIMKEFKNPNKDFREALTK